MAITEQTQAIIDRLKAEGDLIRNSGTNSIRSVNIKMEKFDGLFTSINAQVSEQTAIMKAQLGLAEDAQEKSRTQEQFEELNNQRNTNSQQNQDARANEDRLGDRFIEGAEKIGEKFTLKNMALMAAGGFVTYNLLKGFIEQGLQDNLLGMGDLKDKIASFDIGSFQENIASMKTSLESASANLQYFADKIKEITDMNLMDWATAILTGIGTLTLLNTTASIINKLLPGKAGIPLKGKPAANAIKAALLAGGSLAALKSIGYSDADIKKVQAEIDADEALKAKQAAAYAEYGESRSKAPVNPVPSNKPPVAMVDGPDSMKAPNINVVDMGNGQIRYQDADNGNRFISREKAVSQLSAAGLGPDGLPMVDTKPPVKTIKPGDIGRKMLQEGGDRLKQSVVANVAKAGIKAIPLLGAVAGVAFAGWSLIRGDTTTAALEGTSIFLPSVSGTAVDITAIATAVFFEFYGQTYNPANEDHNVVMAEIIKLVQEEVDQYLNGKPETGNQNPLGPMFEGYENMSQEDFINMGTNATGTGFGSTGGLDYSAYLQGYDPYSGTFSSSTGSRSRGGGRGPRPGQGQGYGVLSAEAMETIAQNNRQANVERLAPAMQAYLDSIATESSAPVIVHAPQNNVTAPVSVVDGGTQTSINSVTSMGGGSGSGPMPYGMTSGLVQ